MVINPFWNYMVISVIGMQGPEKGGVLYNLELLFCVCFVCIPGANIWQHIMVQDKNTGASVYADVKALMNILNNRGTFLFRNTSTHIHNFLYMHIATVLFQLTFVREKLLLMSNDQEDISSWYWCLSGAVGYVSPPPGWLPSLLPLTLQTAPTKVGMDSLISQAKHMTVCALIESQKGADWVFITEARR